MYLRGINKRRKSKITILTEPKGKAMSQSIGNSKYNNRPPSARSKSRRLFRGHVHGKQLNNPHSQRFYNKEISSKLKSHKGVQSNPINEYQDKALLKSKHEEPKKLIVYTYAQIK